MDGMQLVTAGIGSGSRLLSGAPGRRFPAPSVRLSGSGWLRHPLVESGFNSAIAGHSIQPCHASMEVYGEADQVPSGWGIGHRSLRIPPKAGTVV